MGRIICSSCLIILLNSGVFYLDVSKRLVNVLQKTDLFLYMLNSTSSTEFTIILIRCNSLRGRIFSVDVKDIKGFVKNFTCIFVDHEKYF